MLNESSISGPFKDKKKQQKQKNKTRNQVMEKDNRVQDFLSEIIKNIRLLCHQCRVSI